MRDAVPRAARLLFLPTIALLVIAVFASGELAPAVRVYALVVCAVGLGLAVAGLRRAFPRASRPPRAPASRGRRPEPPRSLAQLENEAAMGIADALDLHFRLRPHLRAIAAGLLEGRRGIDLDREPEAARQLLGDEAWQLLRADRPEPRDRHARGFTPETLERVVGSLERL
ncbi:MAG TPA: hypothetical protein VH305_02660 [Gaiella sp.]|jgi:hypothetical protein